MLTLVVVCYYYVIRHCDFFCCHFASIFRLLSDCVLLLFRFRHENIFSCLLSREVVLLLPPLVTEGMSSALSPAGLSYGEAVSWMDSTEEEVAVWVTMIKNPNHWVDATLPVRTDLAHWS